MNHAPDGSPCIVREVAWVLCCNWDKNVAKGKVGVQNTGAFAGIIYGLAALELLGVGLRGDAARLPLGRVDVAEGPEVDDEDDVGPEVAEHLGDHGEGPLEGAREAVLYWVGSLIKITTMLGIILLVRFTVRRVK